MEGNASALVPNLLAASGGGTSRQRQDDVSHTRPAADSRGRWIPGTRCREESALGRGDRGDRGALRGGSRPSRAPAADRFPVNADDQKKARVKLRSLGEIEIFLLEGFGFLSVDFYELPEYFTFKAG